MVLRRLPAFLSLLALLLCGMAAPRSSSQSFYTARIIRLVIEDARPYPLISNFGVHFTPHATPGPSQKKTGTREEKAI